MRALRDEVILRSDAPAEESPGGILIARVDDSPLESGAIPATVVAVGPAVADPAIVIDARVYFRARGSSAAIFEHEGVEYSRCSANEIDAIIAEEG